MTGLAGGGFVVTWSGDGIDVSGFGVAARVYDSSGVAVGDSFIPADITASDQVLSDVAATADGGFVIVWNTFDPVLTGDDIRGQRYDADGRKVGGAFNVASLSLSSEVDPTIDIGADGTVTVTWIDLDASGTNVGIMARRFSLPDDVQIIQNNIQGTADADTIFGPDTGVPLDGLAGDDRIFGGAGNDTITGGVGNDFVDGGDGVDTAVFSAAASQYTFAVENGGVTVSALPATSNDGSDTNVDVELASFGGTIGSILGGGFVDQSAATTDLTLTASAANMSVIAGSGNDTLTGTSGSDLLSGGAGADVLDGGAGADVLLGGAGGDTYIVGSVDTVIVERAVDASPLDGVEVLGVADLRGDGSTFVLVRAPSSTQVWEMEAGTIQHRSTLPVFSSFGYVGFFSATGDSTNPAQIHILLQENGGTNQTLRTLQLTGNTVQLGNGTSGSSGLLPLPFDLSSEDVAWPHADLVRASVDYTLGDNVENLTLTGSGNLSGTGNALNNRIIGNTGDNILTGGAGSDVLDGGLGNDTFVYNLGDGSDAITDAGGTDVLELGPGVTLSSSGFVGNDLVLALGDGSTVTLTDHALGGGVETVRGGDLPGELVLAAGPTGTAAAGLVSGTSGDDRIDGGGGADLLFGAGGTDTFVISSFAAVTTIGDFAGGSERIAIDSSVFSAPGLFTGTLRPEYFQSSATAGVNSANGQHILFNTTTKELFYDADGLAGGAVHFATLDGFTGALSAANFDIEGVNPNAGVVLTGTALSETLTGTDRLDIISAGAGNDTIIGNGGADILSGNSGADRFSFTVLDGSVATVTDFNYLAGDTLGFSGAAFSAPGLFGGDTQVRAERFLSGDTCRRQQRRRSPLPLQHHERAHCSTTPTVSRAARFRLRP